MTIKRKPSKRRVTIRKRGKPSTITTTELPHIGSLSAPVYLILDPLVSGSTSSKMPLSKTQMKWFVNHLSNDGGFSKKDVCIISCAPPVTSEVWGQGRLINEHLKNHRQELMSLIRHNRPKFIMPFGAKACQQVIGRAVQITKVRGQPIGDKDVAFGIPMLPMLSPFFAQRQPENAAAFKSDMQTAGRIYKSNYDLDASILTYKHSYKWCYDLKFLLKKKPKRIAVDIEGVGLTPFDPKTTLLTVQISWKKGHAICIPINYDRGKLRYHKFIDWGNINRPRLLRQLKKLLEDPDIEVVGQNFKFDWLYLWYKLGIRVANYKHDTMLLAHLHDENQRKINLDDLVRQHVPEMAGFNDIHNQDPTHHNKSRMDLLPPETMLEYSCGDADASLRLTKNLLKLVGEDTRLMQCYDKVTMPAQRAFCDIELNGFPVSKKQLVKFEAKLRSIQKKERMYLLRQIPDSIKDKWRDSGVGLKVTRRAILVDWLYEHKDGMRLKPVAWTKTNQPSISSKDAMPYYAADHPVIYRLMAYIKNDKLLNTYAKGFHKYIYDGLIRPSYGLAGTVTGRSMSRDPNGQNFPKRGELAKEYRKVFEAPKGWVFVSCDLSQAELRIAAIMSGDPTMLKVYADGGDIHKTTAAGTMGISIEEFEALPDEVKGLKRFQAKAVNFGFLYGMWWVKFRQYAKTEYGIDFTEDEAKQIREDFFNTYPMLEYWHREVQEIVLKNGYIRTFDGRIRHLPNVNSPDESVAKMAQRQAINSPVQSIASDLGLMSLGRMLPYLKEKGFDAWLKPCGFIHDAIVCVVREDKVAEACRLVKWFMENNPLHEWFDWEPEIPIIADAEIGRTLGATYEIDETSFTGNNKDANYVDILNLELEKLLNRMSNEADSKKRKKLQSSISSIKADILLSGKIYSQKKKRHRILSKRKRTAYAKIKNPRKVKIRSRKICKA